MLGLSHYFMPFLSERSIANGEKDSFLRETKPQTPKTITQERDGERRRERQREKEGETERGRRDRERRRDRQREREKE